MSRGFGPFGDDLLAGKRLEFLKHVVPGLCLSSGCSINPGDPADAIYLKLLPAAARALGKDLVVFEARAPAEFEMAFAAAARAGMQALFVSQSPLFNSQSGAKSRRWRRASACRQSTASANSPRRAA